MVKSLLKMGLQSIDRLASGAAAESRVASAGGDIHPLAAYPRLRVLLTEAERSGSLAAERRRIMGRTLSA